MAALEPAAKHAFPVGRDFALALGYPLDVIASMPSDAVEAFAGVSNVSVFANLNPGDRVLDLGCGAGLDSLIAARRVGPGGFVCGIDFSAEMLARARSAARASGIYNASFCRAAAEEIPLRTGSIDVAIVNGIFNLNPRRAEIFAELARAIHPGGELYAAELILREPLRPDEAADESNWFA
jgi:ubiquinone/menaquinone biosynthesis C-methylase UbiE